VQTFAAAGLSASRDKPCLSRGTRSIWFADNPRTRRMNRLIIRGRAFYRRNEIIAQPRRRAASASAASGSTATGRVTRSRSGRSLCESL